MGDGGNWIDPLSKRECLFDQRIVDYYHAVEHLYEAARAALGKDTPEARALAEQLKDHLWAGRVDEVIVALHSHADRLGRPRATDGSEHPRRVLANNVGYFTTHRRHVDYPTYRRKGWPIGSGEVYGYRIDPAQSAEVRAGVTPKVNADNPIGRWNRFVITMRGDRLTVVLNGQTVLDDAQLPGVAARGPIALQHHGAPIEFANLYIKRLE